MSENLLVELPRKIVYGDGAVSHLKPILNDLEQENVVVLSGNTNTRKITENEILKYLEDHNFTHLTVDTCDIESARMITEEIKKSISKNKRPMLIVVGGGRVLDLGKVAASWSNINYISIPTNTSHDGFASPYLNFLLNKELQEATRGGRTPRFCPVSPLVIVGDTDLVKEAPYKSVQTGVGDLVAKYTAYLDWELAHRLRGEPFDIFAATFGRMSAQMLEKDIIHVANRSDHGIRTVIKALGGSGVAVNVAGSSRPASGSEHLISHYIELMGSERSDSKLLGIPHGAKCGLATILMMFLHGKDWKKIKTLLNLVGAPTNVKSLGIDRDILLEALINAHTIRPGRYTILGDGLNKTAAENVIEQTEAA